MAFKMTKYIVRLVKLQRTCYAKTHPDEIPNAYYKSCQADLKNILPYLPANTGSILDIGCGVAGIDILLHRHYRGKVQINLFDLERVDPDIAYGFSENPSAYNQFKHVRKFFDLNGVARDQYTTSSAFPVDRAFDVSISLISMGFHYPVDQYLPLINSDMLILDVRRSASEQLPQLQSKYKSVDIAKSSEKYDRMVCRGLR
jgi:SAM-dependent methyltransferase